MIGFVIGSLCLVAFVLIYKRGLRSHEYGRRARRWLFYKLDTSPAQERLVRNAMLNVKHRFKEVTKSQATTRRQLADMLRAGSLDQDEVRQWFVDREHELTQVREAAVAAFGEVYEALDDRQREQLATWIESGRCGPRSWHRHAPYRAPSEAA